MSKSSCEEEETMTMDMKEEEFLIINWLELPEHIFLEILAKFTCFEDYIRFGAVCVTWRSLLFSEHCPELPTQPPLLIVPTPLSPPPLHEEEKDDADVGDKNKNKRNKKKKKKNKTTPTQSCSFYRITDNKAYNQLQLAMPFNRHFRGSGHGWLVTMDDDGLFYPIRLINPFFFPKPCKEIQLPPITNLLAVGEDDGCKKIIFLGKAVLSADPISNPKDYTVMVIDGGFQKLAFYKPGGNKKAAWTTLVETEYENDQGPFEDIIFYKHKFYALHHYGELFVCDLERRIAEEIVESMPGLKPYLTKYLVESSGDMLLVLRLIDTNDIPYKSTTGFNVFKLLFLDDPTGEFLRHYLDDPLSPEMDGIEPEWVQVNDLYGCAIFIGYNGSLSVSAANFPGVKPNCIYYTDNDRETFHLNPGYCGLGQDFGLFNLEDENRKALSNRNGKTNPSSSHLDRAAEATKYYSKEID